MTIVPTPWYRQPAEKPKKVQGYKMFLSHINWLEEKIGSGMMSSFVRFAMTRALRDPDVIRCFRKYLDNNEEL